MQLGLYDGTDDWEPLPASKPKRRRRPAVKAAAAVASPRLRARREALRERDRVAIRRILSDAGFEHAAQTLAGAVAVAIVGTGPIGARGDGEAEDAHDRELGRIVAEIEHNLTEALAHLARQRGWKGTAFR